MFPKWPLRLRAEPRLWGAVVLDHPRNPAALRGKAFAMESLLTSLSQDLVQVRDAEGQPIRYDGRSAWLSWNTMRNVRAFGRARHRWIAHRLMTGTLDVVGGDPWKQRDERRALWFILGPMSLALVLTLWFGFVLPFIHGPQSQHTLLDWLILCGFCGMTLGMSVLPAWVMSRGRRSCSLYRLTSTTITPLDGPMAGQELPLASCIKHGTFAMRLARLHFSDRTLIIDPPPVPLADLLGRQEQQRLEKRSVRRRLVVYGVVGVVLYVAAVVFTAPITGMPIWRPLLAIGVGLPLYALLGMHGERWLKRLFAAVERRSRQRKNRHAAAAGRARR